MTQDEEREQYRRAARLGAIVSLQDLVLRGLEVNGDVDGLGGDLDVESPDPSMRCGRYDDGAILRFEIRYSLIIRAAGASDTQSSVFSLAARLGLNYACPPDASVDEDDALAFGAQSVLLTSYPYFRELVHTMTSRTGLPPLVLGTLRLPLIQDINGEELHAD